MSYQIKVQPIRYVITKRDKYRDHTKMFSLTDNNQRKAAKNGGDCTLMTIMYKLTGMHGHMKMQIAHSKTYCLFLTYLKHFNDHYCQ